MDTTEIEASLAKVAARVPAIIADAAAAEAAMNEVVAAEAALLDRLVELVRPALRALGTRPLIANAFSGGKDNCNPWDEETRAEWRGVCAFDCKPGPTRDKRGDDSTGIYASSDLFLAADGTWRHLAYSGTWSIWAGAVSGWTATETVMTSAEVARGYGSKDVDAIIATICHAVTNAGSREKVTAKAKARAEKLNAIVALLGGAS
jgi:hypothetical protein